jgi:hypothetical protein
MILMQNKNTYDTSLNTRANAGWKKVQTQLDLEMPVKKNERRWDGGRINKPSPTHLRGILQKIRDSNKTK